MAPFSQKFISIWLARHGPLRSRKPNKQVHVGPSTVFLDPLDEDFFEETLIHVHDNLASICIHEQENQNARTAAGRLDFEDAVNESHGNTVTFTCPK